MMGGLAYMTGPSGRPLRAGASVIDVSGALFGVIGILSALLSRKDTGKFILKNHIMESGGTQGGTTDMHSGTSSTTTYVDSDGTILGFKDTWSDSYGSGSSFMDANWNWLGGAGSDEWMSWSQVSVDIMSSDTTPVKTGTRETRTETEKNYDRSDEADEYTGQQRVTVTEYDLDFMMVGRTETTSLDNGNKQQFIFNGNWEMIGEYTYELKADTAPSNDLANDYTKVITDKYGLFQLEEWNFTDDYMKGFAEREGYTNLVDGDGDGQIDAYTEDYDGDGVSDLSYNFGKAIVDATIFGTDPTIDIKTICITGLTFTANGFKFVLNGTFTLIDTSATTGDLIMSHRARLTEAIFMTPLMLTHLWVIPTQ